MLGRSGFEMAGHPEVTMPLCTLRMAGDAAPGGGDSIYNSDGTGKINM